ncbi:MAG: 30S ribosomal protein S12 methylthiotransferase RimO [Acidimicrobiales bacterium]
MAGTFWIETLGCPKNQVDSDKLAGSLLAGGYVAASGPGMADVVVVNTCAFIEPARAESVETILALSDGRREGARLVVTGCLAARAGEELAAALPEVDVVADVGVPVEIALGPGHGAERRWRPRAGETIPALDLLEMPRRPAEAPWAYVKVAEGCDRRCGFCAIPGFRGPQRSRPLAAVLDEVDQLGVREVVLVAQDLASYGHDRSARVARSDGARSDGAGSDDAGIVALVEAVAERTDRVRLLYLYPSSLTDALVDAICATDVPYFDLSLQHVSGPLLRRMRRVGDTSRFLRRIEQIRAKAPDAAMRSSFILGYPGETEEDHDQLLAFLAEAELDWAGFFTFSEEPGTFAASLPEVVPAELALERLRECTEIQDALTARRRAGLVGSVVEVLVDAPGVGRSHREAPEIDGVVHLPLSLQPGSIVAVEVVAAEGPDLVAVPCDAAGEMPRRGTALAAR